MQLWQLHPGQGNKTARMGLVLQDVVATVLQPCGRVLQAVDGVTLILSPVFMMSSILVTRSALIWLTCTKPSSTKPTSTKAPKGLRWVTVPSSTLPTCQCPPRGQSLLACCTCQGLGALAAWPQDPGHAVLASSAAALTSRFSRLWTRGCAAGYLDVLGGVGSAGDALCKYQTTSLLQGQQLSSVVVWILVWLPLRIQGRMQGLELQIRQYDGGSGEYQRASVKGCTSVISSNRTLTVCPT